MAKTEIYDKLVRDKIVDIKLAEGEKVNFHIADDEEYQMRLRQKVLEEAKEFHSTGNVDEIADLMEVVEALLDAHGLDMKVVEKIREEKNKKKGAFDKRVVIDSIELPDNYDKKY